MCKNSDHTPEKATEKSGTENKQKLVILEDIDDLIFGDERTVPSNR